VRSFLGAPDVVIVGGGPAGAVAGLIAARAGARVRILERARFPRDKLCGDTLNPGALALLRRLGVADPIEVRGLPVDGMIVSGEGGVEIIGRYPGSLQGRAIVRRELDAILLQAAIDVGCEVHHAAVRRAVVADDRQSRDGQRVVGVIVDGAGGARYERRLDAPVIIGADGRKSVLAFGLGLSRHPARPRRWAVGAYVSGVRPETTASDNCLGSHPRQFGEMHVRKNCYIGVAPIPGGLTNVCVVREMFGPDAQFRDPVAVITSCLRSDPGLRDRFAAATFVAPPVVLGPLAVDPSGGSIDGLILAGDAAGFIDPMTGDGLHFAIRGGELAADAALRVLANGWDDVHTALAAARASAFAKKWRFNRVLRALVASPRAVEAAALGARILPGVLRAVIAHAGDCHVAAGVGSGVRPGVRSGVGSGVR
jgi:flavin-dependent dehydrogenase